MGMATITHELLAIQRRHQTTFARLFAGEAVPTLPAICGEHLGYYGAPDAADLAHWCENELPTISEQLLARGANATAFYPLVVEFIPWGVHFVDALFGARVFSTEYTVWSEELAGSLSELSAVDVARHPLVQWTLEAMRRLLAQLPSPVAITTPIFSSPLNVALNLFGERALLEVAYPEPNTLRGIDAITAVIRDLHLLMRASFPRERVRFYCSSTRYAPDDVGHVCGCSTQLVGADTYTRFFAPGDAAVLRAYPGGGTIHLCGRHTQHLPTWRAMPELRAVQLNDAAADEFLAYYTGLRDDQLIYLAPTEMMSLAHILEISGGRRVIYQGVP